MFVVFKQQQGIHQTWGLSFQQQGQVQCDIHPTMAEVIITQYWIIRNLFNKQPFDNIVVQVGYTQLFLSLKLRTKK